ncbi:hypothetical protein BDW22DRAFT_1155488 [Trametopsis cervina]|nr:hypothetical protein BDW22DRAFT_1155488 [Trametopsis cervina]
MDPSPVFYHEHQASKRVTPCLVSLLLCASIPISLSRVGNTVRSPLVPFACAFDVEYRATDRACNLHEPNEARPRNAISIPSRVQTCITKHEAGSGTSQHRLDSHPACVMPSHPLSIPTPACADPSQLAATPPTPRHLHGTASGDIPDTSTPHPHDKPRRVRSSSTVFVFVYCTPTNHATPPRYGDIPDTSTLPAHTSTRTHDRRRA